MDFYHPLYWALKDEFYLTYRSIYPPLNLLLLKLIGFNANIDGINNGFELRASQPELSILICLFYFGAVAIAINLGKWKKIALGKKIIIFGIIILSAPVLFAMERGNLIFLALPILALYINTENSWSKSFLLAILINIKPYFFILLISYFNLKSFKKVDILKIIFFTSLIFFLLGYFVGMNFIEYFKNFFFFGKSNVLTAEGVVGFPNNLGALARINELIYYGVPRHYNFWFSVLKVVSWISILALIYLSIFKPLNQLELFLSSIVILTNLTEKTGGYILIIYVVLIPYLIDSREYRFLLFPILCIFALPVDWIDLFFINMLNNTYSFLGDLVLSPMDRNFAISLGTVVRPLVNFCIIWLLFRHLVKKY